MTFSTLKYDNQPTCSVENRPCQGAFSISVSQTSDSGPLQDTPETSCLAGVA